MEFNNTTCITETEEINELIDEVNQYLLILQGIILSVIGMVGMVINIFVMIVILANKQLHTRSFMLCLQVAQINILNIFAYLPPILTQFYQRWLFGSTGCTIIAIGTITFLAWRWMAIFLLILDRLLVVLYPFHYFKYANKIMITLSILVLLFSISIPLVSTVIKVSCYTFTKAEFTCTIEPPYVNKASITYFMLLSSLVVLSGSIIPIIMYIVMYYKARHIQQESEVPTQERQEGEQRARCTVLILFVCLVCLTIPAYLTDKILFFTMDQTSITSTHYIFIYLVFDVYACIPITDSIIIIRNRDIKEMIRRIFTNKKHPSQ